MREKLDDQLEKKSSLLSIDDYNLSSKDTVRVIILKIKHSGAHFKKLSFAENYYPDKYIDGICHIAAYFGDDLEELNLSDNQFSEKIIDKLVNSLMKNNRNLQTLNLNKNKVGDSGAISIAKTLATKKNKSFLKKIDLSSNDITNKGCVHLLSSLGSHNNMSEINLSGNKIGDEGVKAIHCLNNTEKLDLSFNDITDIGCEQIADFLKKNCSLRALNLKCNQISDRGFAAIFTALRENSTLRELNIFYNEISKVGIDSLNEALDTNLTLTHLISEVDLDQDIQTKLKRNIERLSPIKALPLSNRMFLIERRLEEESNKEKKGDVNFKFE